MSLWQNTRWTQRQNQSSPTILSNPRTSLSGNSSAATSTVSLVSSNSSNVPPRRPLNQLNLRQDRRSNSIPRSKLVEPSKSDHDPVKTLIGILGELPDSEIVAQGPTEGKEEEKQEGVGQKMEKVDAAGKTLAVWLEELEKDKLTKLSKDIEQRIPLLQLNCNNDRNHGIKSVRGIAVFYSCILPPQFSLLILTDMRQCSQRSRDIPLCLSNRPRLR
jgi:hypothetical protein